MANTFQVLFNRKAASEDFYTQMTSIEVEESVDMPGAFELTLPVSRSSEGDLKFVNDDEFQPYSNVAVVIQADGERAECIFDGFVLSQKLHVEHGLTSSSVRVWGQDASWLMNLEEKAREWVDVTDSAVANSIFDEYGFTPSDRNKENDSPAHTEDGHSLMQRATDIQFLRMQARRTGKFVRVACEDAPGVRTGYFVRPGVEGEAAITLDLSDPEAWTVGALDIEWDVMRPTEAAARQALFTSNDPEGVLGDQPESGLAPLDERDLATFAGQPMKALLTASAANAEDLQARAQALLTDAGWFVRCEGEADLARLGKVLRAGTVAAIKGAGSVHSGKYFVWSVRHSITQDAHRMKFVFVRNAVGPAPAGGEGSF